MEVENIARRQNGGPSQSTPKVRPHPAYGRKSAISETDESELSELSGDELPNEEIQISAINTNGIATQPSRLPSVTNSSIHAEDAATPASLQLSSRKRPRSLDNGSELGGSITGDESLPAEAESPVPVASLSQEVGEFIIRRKRVRH